MNDLAFTNFTNKVGGIACSSDGGTCLNVNMNNVVSLYFYAIIQSSLDAPLYLRLGLIDES